MDKSALEELYRIYKQHPVITTDSRNCPEGSLFFALKGDKFNGNQYAGSALDLGCAYAVIDEPEYAIDERYIVVADSLEALQSLARHHRRQLNIPVIVITGTNGKTTTKELTSAVLAKKYNVLFTQGNLNNHIGVPLTLLRLNDSHEIAVVETGANHPGEIKFLAEIAEPDFGLITNVGKAHLEGFGSFEGVIKTKSELYDFIRNHTGKIFIHHENEYLKQTSQGIDKIEYGETPGLYLSGHITDCSPFLQFEFTHNNQTLPVSTQLIGSYNLPNMLAAAAIGQYFGVSKEDIHDALEAYQPQNKRSQLQKSSRNTIFLDAYNANPTSMKAALENFRQLKGDQKAVILGEMRELGEESAFEHQGIVNYLRECGINTVVLAGKEFCNCKHHYLCFETTEELSDWLRDNPISNHYILMKASRGMQIERCLEYL